LHLATHKSLCATTLSDNSQHLCDLSTLAPVFEDFIARAEAQAALCGLR